MNVSASKWRSGKGRLLGPPGYQPDPVAHPGRRHPALSLAQHLLGQVHTHHPGPAALRELERDARGAGRDVEDYPFDRDDMVDHGRPPLPVLAERQQLGQAVVPGGQRVEQVTREAVGTRKVVGHRGFSRFSWAQRDAVPSPTVTPAAGSRFTLGAPP